ncbi:MAG: KpsF/GutQ family sugar-phosphate isomerase [Alphaproteobacteria bacterium]|nr:KpsF/GutQ family sugar-phosphate isomerase [Alphaproteobacteria bacterium]
MTNPTKAEIMDGDSGTAQSSDLVAARRVLRLEAESLRAMSDALDATFIQALEILFAVTGRVVVTGMGKSGHIARKISATLASTGTPSHFVHPAEASHGDMGMITRADAVLALSNSGETPELGDLIDYCRRFRIPLIALTGKQGSTLAENGDCALILPAIAEACPMGLAPTTSTTAMLAMGDALAVALLERRGFTTEDFQVLHPGGKLGQGLLRVDDIMHVGDELPLTGPDSAMSDVILTMTSKALGCAGVVDGDGRLVGIVTDGDLRRHMSADLRSTTAGEVMTRSPKTIRLGALAAEALGTMNDNKILLLFVVDDGVPVGILHMHDCLRAGIA